MKTVFLVMALSLGSFFLSAQSTHKEMRPHAEFGLKAGLNISNLRIENSKGPDTKASLYAGGLVHIHLTQYFAVQPELMFSGQGFSQTIAGVKNRLSLNYVNLPVLGQFMFGDGFRLESGPQLGILAGAHSKATGHSVDVKDDYKGFDFSWVFGLGYITHSGLGLDARYNLGLSNINDDNSTKVNNRVFQAGLFYQFMH